MDASGQELASQRIRKESSRRHVHIHRMNVCEQLLPCIELRLEESRFD